MPRVINYSDRFDAVREAVYVITLREGPGAISLPAVAQESYMSVRTLQRLGVSADLLPHLGLQWAERQWRYRDLAERRRATDQHGDQRAPLVRELLGCLPDAADDQRVWWALVTTFEGTQEWAQAARAARTDQVERLAATIVAEADIPAADTACERERLCAIIDGLSQRIHTGRVTHADASAAARRQIADLLGAGVQEDDDAA
jgi:hypothetical protein